MAQYLRDLPVGALVKDTQTEYNGDVIIWQILEHAHAGDPEESTALCSKDILCLKAFDAKEPNNTDAARVAGGNNDYADANLLQWLNATTEEWYTAQHEYDQAPTVDYVESNPYETEAGFLSNFTEDLLSHVIESEKDTASLIFLLSEEEVTDANERYKFFDDNSYEKEFDGVQTAWWSRTPESNSTSKVIAIDSNTDFQAFNICGVVPAFCISTTTVISDDPDSDGAYTILWDTVPDEIESEFDTDGDPDTSQSPPLNSYIKKSDLLDFVYPVGSVYMSVNNISPQVFLGGTWVPWGSGRVPVGVDSQDTNFDTVEETGGAKSESYTPSGTNTGGGVGNHKLLVSEMPEHTHTFTGTAVTSGDNSVQHTHSTPNHTHDIKTASPNNTGSFSTSQVEFGKPTGTTYTNDNMFSSSGGGTSGNNSVKHTHSVTAKGTNSKTGGDGNHNHPFTQPTFSGTAATLSHLQPYITCYMWKRTA